MTEPSSWRGLEILVVSPTPSHPQDHGNRKRIFEVCRALQNRGARLHFVHYPAEHDWRHERREDAEAAMRATWDSYQLVPLTRSPHLNSEHEDHTIDEWADRALTDYLQFACRLRRYDVAIVNYTWMSFALEALPASVFKIIDTHDRFSGRREMLQANGIAPEFFHTTAEEEARGLKRADLVWAIKDDERRYFADELGVPDVLALLHAETPREVWRGAPSRDGWLRAGVIGARNNVNHRNIEAFLDAALPVFRRYMAPVKILIAGGAADDLLDRAGPNVEIVGRLADVEDFYASVDVVAAPMAFSTGLKIKVAEAFAAGAPLIAHAHASEGFPSEDLLHNLPSFEAMALALARLSFERTPLEALAAKSRAVAALSRAQVEAALEATREKIAARVGERLLLVASQEALTKGALLHDHLQSAIDGLKSGATLEVFVAGPVSSSLQDKGAVLLGRAADGVTRLSATSAQESASDGLPLPSPLQGEGKGSLRSDGGVLSGALPLPPSADRQRGVAPAKSPPLALEWLASRGLLHSVFFDPALRPVLGPTPSSWQAITLPELLAARPYRRAYLMTDAPEIRAGVGALKRIVVRHDAVEIGGGDADALVEALRGHVEVAGAAPARLRSIDGRAPAIRAAFRRDGLFERLTATQTSDTPPPHLFVLAPAGDIVAAALVELAGRLSARALVLDPTDAAVARAMTLAPPSGDPLFGLSIARMLVDLAPPSALTAVIGEAAARAGVPRVIVPRGAAAYGLWRFPNTLRPASVGRLLQTVALAIAHWPSLSALSGMTSYDLLAGSAFEAGWTQAWAFLGMEEAQEKGRA